jgi:hypothetical protein
MGVEEVGQQHRKIDAVEGNRRPQAIGQEHGKFHVDHLDPGTISHRLAVAGQLLGCGGVRIGPEPAAGRHDHRLRGDDPELRRVELEAGGADDPAVAFEQVDDHEIFDQGMGRLFHAPLQRLHDLDPRHPDAARIGVAHGEHDAVNLGPPLDQLDDPFGGLIDVDVDKLLVRDVFRFPDHVLEEDPRAVPHVTLHTQHLGCAGAVHVDIAVGGERGTTLGHHALGHHGHVEAGLLDLDGCAGTGALTADDQHVGVDHPVRNFTQIRHDACPLDW